MYPPKILLNALLCLHLFRLSTSIDTITANHSIKDGDTIVSNGKMFELGFFSPGKSSKRHVGIWYYQDSKQTAVWVANRDDPIIGTSGVLSINSDGNLVLYQTNQTTVPVWSTSVSITTRNSTVARLLNWGNLELVETGTTNILWQSFDHPTHTMLPLMKLGLNRRTGINRSLTSWKSLDDPGSGNYSYRIDPDGFPQLSIYNGSVKWWRASSWSGERWTGVPEMNLPGDVTNFNFVENQDEVFVMFPLADPTDTMSRVMLNESGYVQHLTSKDGGHTWVVYWDNPRYPPCDYYGLCGAGSNCIDSNDEFVCKCLPGFEPKYRQEWYSGNGTRGCMRKRGMSLCQRGERFERVARVKVPDTSVTRVDMSLDLKACGNSCLSDCSCVAYASAYFEATGGPKGCLTYHGEMMDTKFYPNNGQDLYVRVGNPQDESRKLLLDWRKRFDIIVGIARGILYFHQDSRLTIIHRDLKASNILLDAEMKPKILDFGTAKIFEEDETQANTKRVVGTYDYMSSEYISDGLFSTKSDIFSFGVIILEIISGKRNRSLCHHDPSSYLIQYTWELWRDGKALEVIDSYMVDLFPTNEVLLCIQVGLLCVQDKPKDRPNLSSVIFMLSNETILPSPKKPTFVIRKNEPDSSIIGTKCSINEVTMTTLDAR